MFGINSIQSILINVPITLIALTLHEYAHGWVSTKLGDPTPRMQGRLTLNPMAHLDLWGTVLMVITGFGWAKPVMINPTYYKDYKKGSAITAAAGPLANLLVAIISLILYAVVFIIGVKIGGGQTVIRAIGYFLNLLAIRNLCFMVFNIIPIPPLDGSKVLGLFLSDRAYYTMQRYEQYSMILIMLLSLTGVFSGVIGGGVNLFYNGILNILNSIVQTIL